MLSQQSEVILYIVKLILSGVAAFLAIMLWNRTKDSAWICIVAGAVTGYAGLVYDLLMKLGIVLPQGPVIYGISLSTIIFTVVPSVFFIIALIIMNVRNS